MWKNILYLKSNICRNVEIVTAKNGLFVLDDISLYYSKVEKKFLSTTLKSVQNEKILKCIYFFFFSPDTSSKRA